MCQTSNFTLGFLNVYGSNMRGPYTRKKFVNSKEDPFTDTELRIPEGITQYTEKYGKPDFVIYRADLWDLKHLEVLYFIT